MRWRNTWANWGSPAKLLHWLLALLILGNLGLGYWADGLGDTPTKAAAFYWHKTLGLTVLWLAVLRLAWRLTNPVPRLPPTTPGWQRTLAGLSHFLLYVLMLAMPLSGWAIHSASGTTLALYGWLEVPSIIPDGLDEEGVGELAEVVHYSLFWVICIVVAVHVLAGLKHHLVDGDSVLRRMLPFSRAPDPIRGE